MLHDFRGSMNRRGKTTRNGEFPNLHHENNFMCTSIAITQTARERQGRLAPDWRGKHAGRVEPTIGILRDLDFCEIVKLVIGFRVTHKISWGHYIQ